MRLPTRLVALLSAAALGRAVACGRAGTVSNPPASDAGSAPRPGRPIRVAAGRAVELRWYCCLGTGEDPSRSESS